MARSKPLHSLRLADHSEEYRELSERWASLNAEHAQLEARRAELARSSSGGRAAPSSGALARIAALATGSAQPAVTGAQDEHASVCQRIADIRAALGVLRLRLTEARLNASAAVCDAIKEHYADRVAAIANALVAAHEACAAYQGLTDALNAEQVAWSQLRPMLPEFIGDRGDTNGDLARWFDEAIKAGFIPESLKPASLNR